MKFQSQSQTRSQTRSQTVVLDQTQTRSALSSSTDVYKMIYDRQLSDKKEQKAAAELHIPP
ncbi:hypothetical protein EYF80_067408 [Liparis tanakae]|uniref:Uncharacterized protein n=1 Tax=Liparis tanakae TaxID=230148 RepID=A0A4Z2E195_9TELE|nr:hypothetical protein EYF80_067408 [Liparis tanakae]